MRQLLKLLMRWALQKRQLNGILFFKHSQINYNSLSRWIHQQETVGRQYRRPGSGGQFKISSDREADVITCVIEHPKWTYQEIINELHLNCSIMTISRIMNQHG